MYPLFVSANSYHCLHYYVFISVLIKKKVIALCVHRNTNYRIHCRLNFFFMVLTKFIFCFSHFIFFCFFLYINFYFRCRSVAWFKWFCDYWKMAWRWAGIARWYENFADLCGMGTCTKWGECKQQDVTLSLPILIFMISCCRFFFQFLWYVFYSVFDQ